MEYKSVHFWLLAIILESADGPSPSAFAGEKQIHTFNTEFKISMLQTTDVFQVSKKFRKV